MNESGEPTDKFFAVREIISRYSDIGELKLPEPIGKKAYGVVQMTEQAALFCHLDKLTTPVRMTNPEPMEKLGQDYGFILYTTTVSGPRGKREMMIQEVKDRALVFVNGQYQVVLERGNKEEEVTFAVPPEGAEIRAYWLRIWGVLIMVRI